MGIDVNLLFTWGAVAKEYLKNEILFNEGETANFYFQITEGSVRMYNSNDDGKEFTQGYFTQGESFGEPPLLANKVYPSTAIAFQDCKILKLSKDKFFKILEEYPSIQREFLNLLANRLYSKSISTRDIINQKPEFRILAFLNARKQNDTKELIPFTRQEIANFTGLRVETVIRAISKLHQEKRVEIIKHKLYY